jgi:hypothetical protein
LNIPYNDLARLPHFEVSELAKQDKKHKKGVKVDSPLEQKDFIITYERIENATVCAMEICTQTYTPLMMARRHVAFNNL